MNLMFWMNFLCFGLCGRFEMFPMFLFLVTDVSNQCYEYHVMDISLSCYECYYISKYILVWSSSLNKF
jgi:hypothetical protein